MDGVPPQSIDLPDDTIYSDSVSENEMDESRSSSPLHYPPSIDDLRISVNSCNYPVKVSLDLTLRTRINRSHKGALTRWTTPLQKKHKPVEVITSNKFDALQTPQTQENEDDTGATAENHNVIYLPPPITIDNVKQSHQLLKKLQDITKQKKRGKITGKGLGVYPETPEAYHTIRRYVDAEKLESFTYQLDEEKDLKAVIRGMRSDTPAQEIIDNLRTYGITVNVCHAMTSRKTGKPLPLFLVILPRSDLNINIFNLTDLCYLKIMVEHLRPKIGPAQCYRCQGFFHY
ncbi:nucleic-acid-binding protein from transposon X-element [Trichonephila clavipes]|nr:nucleic-acid-binding protein from transposon X-element [Trichonephila clavipes]